MLKEFKAFAVKGNVIDLAIGVIIGGAFGAIVKSLVSDIIMPPIGLVVGNIDFANWFWVLKEGAEQGPYATVAAAQKAGAVTMNIGLFLNATISFLIVAFAVFMLMKLVNRLKMEEAAAPAAVTEKECPFCCSKIAIQATRCPHCTSTLES